MSETAPPATGTPAILDAGTPAGGAPADWRAGLPEDLRGAPALKDFPDVGALAKSYLHAAQMVGADKATVLRLPKDEADPGWSEVYARLGRPEKADGYGLAGPDGIAPETVGAFAEHVHGLGLSKRQAEGVLGFYAEGLKASAKARQAQQAQAYEANVAALKREWGPSYDDNIHAMRQGVERFGGADLVAKFADAGLANDPAVVKMFAEIGRAFSEGGGLKGGGQGAMTGPVTPEQARAEWASLQRDAEFMGKYMSGDGASVARAKALFEAMTARAA